MPVKHEVPGSSPGGSNIWGHSSTVEREVSSILVVALFHESAMELTSLKSYALLGAARLLADALDPSEELETRNHELETLSVFRQSGTSFILPPSSLLFWRPVRESNPCRRREREGTYCNST